MSRQKNQPILRKTIPKRLRKLLKDTNTTQWLMNQLSYQTNTSQYANGQNTDIETFVRIADYFECPMTTF